MGYGGLYGSRVGYGGLGYSGYGGLLRSGLTASILANRAKLGEVVVDEDVVVDNDGDIEVVDHVDTIQ